MVLFRTLPAGGSLRSPPSGPMYFNRTKATHMTRFVDDDDDDDDAGGEEDVGVTPSAASGAARCWIKRFL